MKNKVFLDVSGREEFLDNDVPGSISIPHYMITDNLDKIPMDSEILIYCVSGRRSNIISKVLEKLGYNVKDIKTASAAKILMQGKEGSTEPLDEHDLTST